MERSVEGGQGKKFWALPEEMPGKGEKKGEGERGLGRASYSPHYTHLRRVERERAGEALLRWGMVVLVRLHSFMCRREVAGRTRRMRRTIIR